MVGIGRTAYRLRDVSREGIGIIMDPSLPTLYMGQRIEAISLSAGGDRLELDGVVAHITKTVEHTVCGIRFSLKNSGELKALERFWKDRTHPEGSGS